MNKAIANMIALGGIVVLMSPISGRGTTSPTVKSDKKAVKASPVSDEVAVRAKPAKPTKKPRRTDAGRLSVGKPIYDFGDVQPGTERKAVFVLTNDGKENLEITRVDVGAHCTATTNLQRNTVLKSGESFDLEVKYEFRVFSPNPVKIEKKMTLHTAAPAMPQSLELTARATVKKLVAVKPKTLRLEVNGSPKTEGVIVLESTDGKAFRIKSCKGGSQTPVFIAFDKEKEATRHELPYTIDAGKLRKVPRGKLTINISHLKVEKVYLRYELVFPFSARPPIKRFSALKPGVPQKAVITVVSNFGQKFELGNITSQQGLIEVLGTTKSKNGYRIEISVTVPAEETAEPAKDENDNEPQKKKVSTKQFKDQLSIEIKDHPEDTLRVLCYGIVRE